MFAAWAFFCLFVFFDKQHAAFKSTPPVKALCIRRIMSEKTP